MTKEACRATLVETFAERCIWTQSKQWVMLREYSQNGITIRDFINDKIGLHSSVIEINGELFATED
jgi:hypothetical protein